MPATMNERPRCHTSRTPDKPCIDGFGTAVYVGPAGSPLLTWHGADEQYQFAFS
jgi:hypothetical protein